MRHENRGQGSFLRLVGAGILCMVTAGCGTDSFEPGLEPIPPPVMIPFEGPGFTFSIPESWEAITDGNKVMARLRGTSGGVHISLEMAPYAVGETPESVIDAVQAKRSQMKGSVEQAKIMISEFPAFRQIYRNDGTRQNPDRVFHLLATPAGKITALGSLKDANQISTYLRDFQAIVHSIRPVL